MASSSRPVITVTQEHQIGDSVITVKQDRQTRDSVITIKQTTDSVITVKKEDETGDILIRVKQQHPTDEITVQVVNGVNKVYDFRVRCDEPLQQLNMRYRERVGMEENVSFRFMFHGRMIFDLDKTANDIGLKDGDRINVKLSLVGD